MYVVWTDETRAFIKASAPTMKDKELAEILTRMLGRPVSLQAVRKQRQKMGVAKAHGRGISKLAEQGPFDKEFNQEFGKEKEDDVVQS